MRTIREMANIPRSGNFAFEFYFWYIMRDFFWNDHHSQEINAFIASKIQRYRIQNSARLSRNTPFTRDYTSRVSANLALTLFGHGTISSIHACSRCLFVRIYLRDYFLQILRRSVRCHHNLTSHFFLQVKKNEYSM